MKPLGCGLNWKAREPAQGRKRARDYPGDFMNPRIDAAAQVFLQIARDAEIYVTPDGRIGLRDAARLIGLSAGTMRNLAAAGAFPVYRIGGHGHRVTIGLLDLATFRESRLSDPGTKTGSGQGRS